MYTLKVLTDPIVQMVIFKLFFGIFDTKGCLMDSPYFLEKND